MMCGLIVLKQWSFQLISFIIYLKFPLCLCVCQGSAVLPCLSGWSGGSSHVKDMQSISAARGVMSLWSRRPTTAGPTTRSVTLTHSRWRTSTATSLMPTRLYHKGKMLGRGGILFHKQNQELATYELLFFLFPSATNISSHKRNA